MIYDEKYIRELEDKGELDPNCKTCIEYFYPRIRAGAAFSDIHAPSHKPSKRCQSGRIPHCTCDTCF